MKDHLLTYKRIALVLVITSLFSFVLCIRHTQGRSKIYWTEDKNINRANLDGSDVENVISALDWIKDIALDLNNRKVYWIEYNKARIQYANLDGTKIKNVTTGFRLVGGGALNFNCNNGKCEGMAFPNGEAPIVLRHDQLNIPICIAIDTSSKRLYWGNNQRWVIQHSDLDGSNIEDIFIEWGAIQQERFRLSVDAESLEIDMKAGKVYFVDAFKENIVRVNLNGTNYENLNINLAAPKELALDLHNQKLYWTQGVLGEIRRANLDGSDVETILAGLDKLGDICLDASSHKMYWIETNRNIHKSKIRQANLDGSNVTDILTGLDTVHGIALDAKGVHDVSPGRNKLTTTWANVKSQ